MKNSPAISHPSLDHVSAFHDKHSCHCWFAFLFITCRFKTLACELTALEQSLGTEGPWAKMGKKRTPDHRMATTLLYAADGKTVSGAVVIRRGSGRVTLVCILLLAGRVLVADHMFILPSLQLTFSYFSYFHTCCRARPGGRPSPASLCLLHPWRQHRWGQTCQMSFTKVC
jgi:hypothetical protein